MSKIATLFKNEAPNDMTLHSSPLDAIRRMRVAEATQRAKLLRTVAQKMASDTALSESEMSALKEALDSGALTESGLNSAAAEFREFDRQVAAAVRKLREANSLRLQGERVKPRIAALSKELEGLQEIVRQATRFNQGASGIIAAIAQMVAGNPALFPDFDARQEVERLAAGPAEPRAA